ncbi:hypothetical protein PINS_up003913 [Pythium insidiosum]|nr:hypothetical protein PINS_up003913 [Pythium insidiosum]
MAIAGCFGGPVFNILLGLGIPMFIAYLRSDVEHVIFDNHAWISLGFLFVTLCSSYCIFRCHGFYCPPWYGKTLLGCYFVYTVINVAMAIRASDVE